MGDCCGFPKLVSTHHTTENQQTHQNTRGGGNKRRRGTRTRSVNTVLSALAEHPDGVKRDLLEESASNGCQADANRERIEDGSAVKRCQLEAAPLRIFLMRPRRRQWKTDKLPQGSTTASWSKDPTITLQRFRAHPDAEALFALRHRVSSNLVRALHAKNVKSNLLLLRRSLRAFEKFETGNETVFGLIDDIFFQRCSDDLVDACLLLHTETVGCQTPLVTLEDRIASTRRLDAPRHNWSELWRKACRCRNDRQNDSSTADFPPDPSQRKGI